MISNWIEMLASSDSRLHKEDVIKQALELAVLGQPNAVAFLELCGYTYDPYVTFGVKQVENTDGLTDRENPWSEFMTLLDQLNERLITGNAARDAIHTMSQRFDSVEWNTVCAPVIRRDLRAGISEKTLNKVLKKTKWEIEVFGCQLATDCTDRPEMRGEVRLEHKLDGVRVLVMMIRDTVVCYSRNGKIFDNFGHIESQLREMRDIMYSRTGYNGDDGVVFDGEVVSSSFQALMRQARRKNGATLNDSVYHIFDVIPLPDFRRGYWNAQQHKRVSLLAKLAPIFSEHCENVAIMDGITVNLDTASGRDVFDRFCKDSVAAGFEGVMIKRLDAPYQCKRDTFWMKYKPTITVDLEVVDVEEGTGRNVGRLGALVCAGVDNDRSIEVNCGSGFSDDDRDVIWRDRDLVIGSTVEVMADAVTQNQDGTYSLRFPRFVRFRDDK